MLARYPYSLQSRSLTETSTTYGELLKLNPIFSLQISRQVEGANMHGST